MLMCSGFKGLCEDFTSKHGPTYYIVPVRISGSAIESLFSRFKYNFSGNLTAVNYESALCRFLTATSVESRNKDGGYRKTDIKVQGILKRKKK